jgi:hypothetical protein
VLLACKGQHLDKELLRKLRGTYVVEGCGNETQVGEGGSWVPWMQVANTAMLVRHAGVACKGRSVRTEVLSTLNSKSNCHSSAAPSLRRVCRHVPVVEISSSMDGSCMGWDVALPLIMPRMR